MASSFKIFPALILALTVTSGLALADGTKSKLAKPPTAAAAKGDAGAAAKKPAAADKDPDDEFPVPPDEPVHRKVFSAAEIQRICHKYEGQLIAYYGDVYKVEGCHRRPLTDNKTVYNQQRDGKKVQDVDGDTVAAIPEGEPVDEATSIKNARGCNVLEGHYITFSNTDVYFVERCKKRIFPDWTTYISHREHRGDTRGEILSLSWIEFARIPAGDPIRSIVDDLFAKLLKGTAGVEIIPVNEACEGIDGKIVSYYSRVYKIEHCRKREIIEPDLYLKKLGFNNGVKEMKSEQWISLPDGKPIDERPLHNRPPDKTAELVHPGPAKAADK